MCEFVVCEFVVCESVSEWCVLEAEIFSGIPRDGKQNHYESRDWDGRGKYLIGSGRDRE